MGRFFHGQIVSARISNGQKTETHPALIIDGEDDYHITGELLVVPISSKISNPCPHYHIQVHSDQNLNHYTKLYYSCWAKCNWGHWIAVERIAGPWGYMPDDLFDKIASKFDEIYDDPKFNDWIP